MSKPIIAVDIDDVLSNSAEGFIAYSNRHYRLNLTVKDYSEDWRDVWRVDLAEALKRSTEFHASGMVSDYLALKGSKSVLQKLKRRYYLIAVTSRKSIIIPETQTWIEKHYPKLFDSMEFAGIYDVPYHEGMLSQTKTDILNGRKARYFIDDQLKHCLAAAEQGIDTILFGDYPWNQMPTLPPGVTRCKDWAAVEAYFDGRS